MPSNESSPFQWLVDEIGSRLAQSLGSMTGEESSAECSRAPQAHSGVLLWWEQPISFPPGAAIYLGASAPAVAALGGKILDAAGVPADDETVRSTYFETLSQAMSATARTLSGRFGREVTCGTGKEAADLPSDTEGPFEVTIAVSGQKLCDVYVSLGRALRSLVRPANATGTLEPSTPSSQSDPAQKHMDVLFDVELPVSVSFGRAQLALRDVIKLTTGSIVELNRSVAEPVEIIVNNCVIARGEVVVVEGNYGVRIDQIITRQERLRTVK